MLTARPSLVFAQVVVCLFASACMDETQERPPRSASDEAARALSPPPASPLPDSAFRSDEEARAPSRFDTRRIVEEPASPRPHYRGATVDLDLKNADLPNVFRLLADVGHVNIVIAGEITGTVTMRLRHVPWDQALDVIVRAKELSLEHDGNVIFVTQRKR